MLAVKNCGYSVWSVEILRQAQYPDHGVLLSANTFNGGKNNFLRHNNQPGKGKTKAQLIIPASFINNIFIEP